ncbi:MAG: hypothetical protein NUV78_03015 [Candidatus Zambryskibacteria bacterium]|nr:hypothetical protein [Candidatus Zambryskibacteria bacterium]
MSKKIQPLRLENSGLEKGDWKILKSLNTPAKIQDFLNKMPFNFEKHGQTHTSVAITLKRNKSHCFEGALLAAAGLWIQGRKPLLLDLVTIRPDFDHVVALFEEDGYWGAISKTNHAVLRYREPIYKNLRELVMSYFNEYYLGDGRKTLRKYSEPFDLSKEGSYWLTTKENLATLAHKLDRSKHYNILTPKQVRNLRKAERIEVDASAIIEHKR